MRSRHLNISGLYKLLVILGIAIIVTLILLTPMTEKASGRSGNPSYDLLEQENLLPILPVTAPITSTTQLTSTTTVTATQVTSNTVGISPETLNIVVTSPEIEVYKDVALASINASKEAMEQMKWAIATLATILIGVGSIIVAYFYKRERDARTQVQDAEKSLRTSDENLKSAQKLLSNLSASYAYLLDELMNIPYLSLSQEMAYELHATGEIDDAGLRLSQVWFSWAKWQTSDSEEAFAQLIAYRDNPQGLPLQIRRLALIEYDKLSHKCSNRNLIEEKDKVKMKKMLELIKLAPVNENEISQLPVMGNAK